MSWERVCACALATKAPFIDPGTAEPVGGTRPEPAASCTRDRARQGCAARCQGNCARSAHFSTDHQKLPERSQRLDCSYPPWLGHDHGKKARPDPCRGLFIPQLACRAGGTLPFLLWQAPAAPGWGIAPFLFRRPGRARRAGLALKQPVLASSAVQPARALGQHDRVSGRSPEGTAKGAKPPSGRNTGLGRQAHIGHPVLVGSGYFAVHLGRIWRAFLAEFPSICVTSSVVFWWIFRACRIDFSPMCAAS